MPAAVTRTTGARPRRPQVRPLGGLRRWPATSSKQSQVPKSAALFYDGPLLVLAGGDLRVVPPGGLAGRDPHAPADAVHQRPVLVTPAGGGRAGIQHRFQNAELSRIELAAGAAGPFEAGACRPPEAKASRQRFADIRVT